MSQFKTDVITVDNWVTFSQILLSLKMPTTEQKENFWLRASNPAVPKYHHVCHPSTLRQAKLACHNIRLFIKQTYTQVKDVIFLTQRCKEDRENK